MTSLPVIMTFPWLFVIMRSLPVIRGHFVLTADHFSVTMVSLLGLLESFTVENRLLPVIMRSLPVSKSHFLFTVEYFQLQ